MTELCNEPVKVLQECLDEIRGTGLKPSARAGKTKNVKRLIRHHRNKAMPEHPAKDDLHFEVST